MKPQKNNHMKQYINLLSDVIENGVWKEPARAGMPRTKEVFCRTMRFNLREGFPLLTTKRMFTKGIVAELLWFLRGDTNIKYLVDNGVHIWDADAYKYYKRQGGDLSKEEWLEKVKSGAIDPRTHTQYGECGFIYGAQWREYEGQFDQILNVIKSLKENPNSRYHLVTAWNPIDFLYIQSNAALPACHLMFQFSVRDGMLDLMMLQRSCDTFLGVPFNIASYALLCHIVALEVGLEPGEFVWVGNSVHLYENHIEQAKEQISRNPLPLCELRIDQKHILDYEIEDFTFEFYTSHPAIKAELSVGV